LSMLVTCSRLKDANNAIISSEKLAIIIYGINAYCG